MRVINFFSSSWTCRLSEAADEEPTDPEDLGRGDLNGFDAELLCLTDMSGDLWIGDLLAAEERRDDSGDVAFVEVRDVERGELEVVVVLEFCFALAVIRGDRKGLANSRREAVRDWDVCLSLNGV